MNSNAENGIEDSEMADQEGENLVTMIDVLKEQEIFEETANAVLGASDDQNCTYLKGFIKRQALYACMTCNPDAKNDATKRAGVCLACSLKCHEDHELVELYTKRNFRCDCGNPKFNSHPCQFTPSKLHLNEENSYNQNFSGLYCICQRPYQDLDVTEEDDMIQCIICEDWLHSAHLDAAVPDDQTAEMVCKSCMQKNNFLHNYSELIMNSDADIVNSTLSRTCNDGSYENINVMDTTNDISINNTEKLHEENINSDSILENKDIFLEQADTTKDDMEIKILPNDKSKQDNANEPEDISDSTTDQEPQGGISTIDNNASVVETEQKSCPSNVSNYPSLELDDKKLKEEQQHIDTTNNYKNVSDNEKSKMVFVSSQEKSKKIIGFESTVTCHNDSNSLNNKSELRENCMPESIQSSISSTVDASNCSPVKDKFLNESKSLETSTCLLSVTENKDISVKKEAEYFKEITSDIKEQNNNPKVIDDNNGTKSSIDKLQLVESECPASVNSVEELLKIAEDNLEVFEEQKSLNDITQTVDDNIANVTECNLGSSTVKYIPGVEELNSTNLIDCSAKEISSDKNDSAVDDTVVCCNMLANLQNNIDKNTATTTDESMCNEKIIVSNNTKLSKSEDSIDDTEKPNKRKLSLKDQPDDLEPKKLKLDLKPCVKPKEIKRKYRGATFWPVCFRQKLCTCNECLSMYKDLSVLFLIDPDDTLTAYENLGREKTNGKPASTYEVGLAALSSLDRVQQINALTEYNKMKDKLLDFLKSFKDRKEVVKEEDIKAFFAGMKPKREPDGVYFCKV